MRLEVELNVQSEAIGQIQLSEELGPDLNATKLLLLDLKFHMKEMKVVD